MAAIQMATNLFTILNHGARLENWALLIRTLAAAVLVLRHLRDRRPSPNLAAAIGAVDKLYLPPQAGWSITQPQLIASIAHLIVHTPWSWGKCVQQSLITYRLLNGYGIPCQICYGVSFANPEETGHAWIRVVNPAAQRLAGSPEPLDRFRVVYISPVPPNGAHTSRTSPDNNLTSMEF